MLGIGVSLSNCHRGVFFTPLSLFANGEQGAWYDPSDISSMYQDEAGTTPAEVGSPVGFLTDKSGNGLHAVQATSGARPILRQDSGGNLYLEFDGSRSLTVSGSASAFKFLHDGSGGSLFGAARFGNTNDPNAAYGLCGTNGASSGKRGIAIYSDDRTATLSNDSIKLLLSTGGTLSSANDAVPSNANAVIGVTTATAGCQFYVNGAASGAPAVLSPLAAVNATHDFQIGAAGNGVAPMIGRVYGLVIRASVLSASERGQVSAYLAGKAGVS